LAALQALACLVGLLAGSRGFNMGMFGTRKPPLGQIPGLQRGPYDTPPTWGGPPQETMDQVGAMEPNTQAMTKKPGFFAPGQTGRHIVGFIGDALQQMSGGQPTYMPQMMQMKQQDAEIRARLQAALEKRKADREDKQWEWENKPQEERAPYRWESNDGSLMEVGPDGQPRVVYKDPTAKVVFQPDGLGGGKWITQPTTQNLVPIGGTLPPKGGPVQQAPDTFPYR
jgi:hypothetical protein